MQYNYDFHLHHQLVDQSQMLEEFESFYYNWNAHNGSWYGELNFLSDHHLIWYIEFRISGKGFLYLWGK